MSDWIKALSEADATWDSVCSSYDNEYKYLTQKAILDSQIALTNDETAALERLDSMLQTVEKCLKLSEEKPVQWLDRFLQAELSSLRRYIANQNNLPLLQQELCFSPHEYTLFYGTLLGNSPRQEQLGLEGMLEFVARVQVEGSMFELLTCPGLKLDGDFTYSAELYKVLNEKAFSILDEFEEYVPAAPETSRYYRESIWIPELQIDTWVYVISSQAVPNDAVLVTDSSWSEFVQRTGKKLPQELPPLTFL